MCQVLIEQIIKRAASVLGIAPAPIGGDPAGCDWLHVRLAEQLVDACECYVVLLTASEGDTPAPQPAKAPRDGSTNDQLQCVKLAYLLYRVELLDGVPPATAWSNYCANFDGCYQV